MATYWATIIEYILRLLPAGSIIGAALIARQQIRSARRATAITIAKNHYKDLLIQFMWNSDIVFAGTTESSFAKLRANKTDYFRYRWLATTTLFSLQEIYLTLGDDPHWRRVVTVISSVFKIYLTSSAEMTPYVMRAWNSEFIAFVIKELKTNEHPMAKVMAEFDDAAK